MSPYRRTSYRFPSLYGILICQILNFSNILLMDLLCPNARQLLLLRKWMASLLRPLRLLLRILRLFLASLANDLEARMSLFGCHQ